MSADPIPFALPDLGDAEVEAVVETLRSGWITTGPKTKAFEEAFARAVDGGEGIAVSSCTAALHLALEAMGVGEGDEVVVPTTTFAATAEVVQYLGARPVLVDVLEDDHEIDPAAFERAITERTRAVIPVHFGGQPADLDAILAIGRANDIGVVEDAAHAFPAAYRGRPIGSIGDVTCFSFYATKTITTGEGGMITTRNTDWAARMRSMSLHGLSRDAWKRYRSEGSWYYEIVAPGFKYNLTDIASAMGLVQLDRAEAMRDRRRAIAEKYHAAFADEPAIGTLAVHSDVEHAHHLFVIKVDDAQLTIGRDAYIEALREAGVGCSVHFIPLHLHPFYRERFGYRPEDLPVATAVYGKSISLPIYSKMTDAQADRVIDVTLETARRNRR